MPLITFNKTCSCGLTHTKAFSYKINSLGVWITCSCKSTMLVPLHKITKVS